MSLELPPLVRSGVFCFFWLSRGVSSSVFAVFLAHFLKWVILDYIAHGSFIWVFTVVWNNLGWRYQGNNTMRWRRTELDKDMKFLKYQYGNNNQSVLVYFVLNFILKAEIVWDNVTN